MIAALLPSGPSSLLPSGLPFDLSLDLGFTSFNIWFRPVLALVTPSNPIWIIALCGRNNPCSTTAAAAERPCRTRHVKNHWCCKDGVSPKLGSPSSILRQGQRVSAGRCNLFVNNYFSSQEFSSDTASPALSEAARSTPSETAAKKTPRVHA